MGQFRIPYGFARGPYANFFTRTDNLFSQADATPDVTNGNLFWANNSGSTTITNFDLSSAGVGGGIHQQFEGKEIVVFILDTATAIQGNNSTIYLAGSDAALQGANTVARFLYHNSAWYEISRSVDQTSFTTVSSMNIPATGQIAVSNKKVVNVLTGASSALTLRGATGAEQGQALYLFASNSAFTMTVNSGATNTFVLTSSKGAASFVVGVSGLMQFVFIGDRWYEQREGNTAAAIL